MLQPTRLPRWRRTARPREARGGARPSRPRWHEAASEISSGRERSGPGDQACGRHDDRHEWPPPLVCERPGLLRPPDRREPRDGAVADVPHRSHDERGAEHRSGGAVHDSGVLGDLGGQDRHAGEEEPDQGERRPKGDRPGGGKILSEQSKRHDHPDGHVHGGHRERGGCSRRMLADRQGTQQLHAAGLLLTSREAADHQQAHQCHGHEADGTRLERHLPAHGVETLRRTVEGDGGSVSLRSGRRLVEIVLGRVETLDARRRHDHQRGDGEDPDQDPGAVAAHDEAGELGGAGELGHRTGHGRALRLPSTSARSPASSSP